MAKGWPKGMPRKPKNWQTPSNSNARGPEEDDEDELDEDEEDTLPGAARAFALKHMGGNLWIVEMWELDPTLQTVKRTALTSADTKANASAQMQRFAYNLYFNEKLPSNETVVHV